MAEPTAPASWVPTRKWLAQVVTGAIGLAVMLLTGDSEITDPEIVAIGSWLVAALASYIYPNEATATGTGVRAKKEVAS